MADKFNFDGLDKKARGAMESALIIIGNEAKNFFVDNFKKQGFDNKGVSAWTPRKKGDKRAGRAILVKSGDLRRSIRTSKISNSALEVTIATDLKYAAVHNEGIGRMPKRQFIGDSENLKEKVKKVLFNKLDNLFK